MGRPGRADVDGTERGSYAEAAEGDASGVPIHRSLGGEASKRSPQKTVEGPESGDSDSSYEAADAAFRRVVGQPYETIFVDESVTQEKPDPEAHLLVRNLDTGDARRVGDGALSPSFVGEQTRPREIGDAKHCWSGWWAEKRQRDERLWCAAESGSLKEVEDALAAPVGGGPPAEVNSQSLHGRTALHIAASVGKPETVKALLDARACVDQQTDGGLTALHVACQRGHLGVASLLLDRGADVCREADDGNVPLHVAAARGHGSVASLLLERGCGEQLHVWNRLRQRPHEVAMNMDVAMLFQSHMRSSAEGSDKYPLEDGKQEDHYAGRTPFHDGTVLLRNARSDVVKRLLQRAGQNVATADHEEGEASPQPVEPVSPPRSSAKPPGRLLGTSADVGSPKRRSKPFVRLHPEGRPSGIEQVGPDTFDLVKVLGRGSFGEVFLVRHKISQEDYAMKILQTHRVRRNNIMKYALTERNVLTYIHHPYIVSLHWAFQTSNHLVLILQFCSGGNLQKLITSVRRLEENLARLYEAELTLAIGHLHERNIVFRDMKPENVVIDGEGHCMLTDFGLSKEGVEDVRGGRSFCGSLAFIAPEILQHRGHGRAVDIYGLGVMLYAMVTGMPPYYHRDRDTLLNNIRHARLVVPPNVSLLAASLIEALMNREPSQRLGASQMAEVKGHGFFAQMDFEALARREVPVPGRPQTPQTGRQSPDPTIRSPFTGCAGRCTATGWRFPGRQTGGGSPGAGARSADGAVQGWEFSAVHPSTSASEGGQRQACFPAVPALPIFGQS